MFYVVGGTWLHCPCLTELAVASLAKRPVLLELLTESLTGLHESCGMNV